MDTLGEHSGEAPGPVCGAGEGLPEETGPKLSPEDWGGTCRGPGTEAVRGRVPVQGLQVVHAEGSRGETRRGE